MIPELEQFGFTRNEANVYLAALKLGTCSVQQLANTTGLNRITVHSIVEKYEGLRIFSRSYEGKRRRVSPATPERLTLLLEQKEEELTRKKKVLSHLMPSLEDLFRQTKRGLQVLTFHGEKGYEQMCEDILTTKTETLEYANIDALNAVIGPYIAAGYLPAKFKLQIRTKFLYLDTPNSRQYIQQSYMDAPDASPMEVKFVPPEEFPIDTFFVIYDDKLAIFTPSTMDGVIIQDKAINAAMRPFFSFVWSRAGTALSNH
ncbi:MAG: hypothetical protein PHE68_01180 [Candidatus Peribacteraceae bacterium]|nr:hypothetical protein [Candidatus Peribacteraceae bacterium]MDD5074409.1 hypothetical protein [Candidatus Peribacteraceae bacterium]